MYSFKDYHWALSPYLQIHLLLCESLIGKAFMCGCWLIAFDNAFDMMDFCSLSGFPSVTLYFSGGAEMALGPNTYLFKETLNVCSQFPSHVLQIEFRLCSYHRGCGSYDILRFPTFKWIDDAVSTWFQRSCVCTSCFCNIKWLPLHVLMYTFCLQNNVIAYCMGWLESTSQPGYQAFSIFGGTYFPFVVCFLDW